jgi:hypothetical protein
MKPTFNYRIYIPILLLLLSSLACGLGQPAATPTRIPPTARVLPTQEPTKTEAPTATNPPTKASTNSGNLMHTWASTGEASSEYGSDSWSALQVAGAPDTPTCGDNHTAWASANSNTVESVTAYYVEEPLIPTEINIVESYNPSQVVKVELIDLYAAHSDAIIYQAKPKAVSQCPYTLSIPVTGIDYPIMGVRVTVDQSVLGLGWNEIDAIELVGNPEGGPVSQPPVGSQPMPGLVGTWQDPETVDTFVIAWQNNKYVVTSITWKGTSYPITYQSWQNGSLTWAYYEPEIALTIQYQTTSLSGDKLNVSWSYNDGTAGDEILYRVP